MTHPPDFRIAANDPTLAHAAAYGQIKRLRGATAKVFNRIDELEGKTAVPRGAQLMRAHFGKLILHEDVTRLQGSRPKARWLALDANTDGGGDMVAIVVEVDKLGWNVRDLMLWLSPHAVARLMQRTTGSSSLDRFATVLRNHLLCVVPLARKLPKDHRLTTAGPEGAMLWVPHQNGVRATTWLAVESMSDPTIARACRSTKPGQIAAHMTKMTTEKEDVTT